TRGQLGPWNRDDPGLTPAAGKYVFSNAQLNDFKGLGGVLSSTGDFTGVLQRLDVDGQTNTPDFSLDIANHPMPLQTQFHAIVDGTNGNTLLDPVRAKLGDSVIEARGGVYKPKGEGGRTVELRASAKEARLEDLMRLTVSQAKPPMLGFATFQTEIVIP